MRPRVFPAEDAVSKKREDRLSDASMRPRVFPAEDQDFAADQRQVGQASMRPRVFPAEDRTAREALVAAGDALQ